MYSPTTHAMSESGKELLKTPGNKLLQWYPIGNSPFPPLPPSWGVGCTHFGWPTRKILRKNCWFVSDNLLFQTKKQRNNFYSVKKRYKEHFYKKKIIKIRVLVFPLPPSSPKLLNFDLLILSSNLFTLNLWPLTISRSLPFGSSSTYTKASLTRLTWPLCFMEFRAELAKKFLEFEQNFVLFCFSLSLNSKSIIFFLVQSVIFDTW